MISDSNRALCPECGAPCTLSWSGLDLVENTGDETLATKHYEFVYSDVDKLKEALKQAKEALDVEKLRQCLDVIQANIERNKFNRVDTTPDIRPAWNTLSDIVTKADEALETINKLGL